MKKNKNLTIVLYVFVVLALMYTCFTIFQSYSAVVSYYGSSATKSEVILYVISNAFMPFMMTVVLYALACMNETLFTLLPKEEPVEKKEVKISEQEDTEEITDEKIEKLVEDKIYELKQD